MKYEQGEREEGWRDSDERRKHTSMCWLVIDLDMKWRIADLADTFVAAVGLFDRLKNLLLAMTYFVDFY